MIMSEQSDLVEHSIPLGQMITALRQDLETAVLQGQGHPAQFQAGDIE